MLCRIPQLMRSYVYINLGRRIRIVQINQIVRVHLGLCKHVCMHQGHGVYKRVSLYACISCVRTDVYMLGCLQVYKNIRVNLYT